MAKKIFPIFLIASFLLSACGSGGGGAAEQTPPTAEFFTAAAPTATAETAKIPGMDVPVSPEKIAVDGELIPVEGDDFQNLRKGFEESPISFYDAATGQLSQSETGGESGFTVLAANKVSIGGVEAGETILFGEFSGGRPGYFVQGADGVIAGTQAYRFAGAEGIEEQVWFVDANGERMSLAPSANVEPKFGYEYDPETGEVNTFYVFDSEGVAHKVPALGGVGKVAVPSQIEKWYEAARILREGSDTPENWRWEYTEEGELTLVGWLGEVREGDSTEPNIELREARYFWNEETGVWEERKVQNISREEWKALLTGPYIGMDGKEYPDLSIYFTPGEYVDGVYTDAQEVLALPSDSVLVATTPSGDVYIKITPEEAAEKVSEGGTVYLMPRKYPGVESQLHRLLHVAEREYANGLSIKIRFTPNPRLAQNLHFFLSFGDDIPLLTDPETGLVTTPWLPFPEEVSVKPLKGFTPYPDDIEVAQLLEEEGIDPEFWVQALLDRRYGGVKIGVYGPDRGE